MPKEQQPETLQTILVRILDKRFVDGSGRRRSKREAVLEALFRGVESDVSFTKLLVDHLNRRADYERRNSASAILSRYLRRRR